MCGIVGEFRLDGTPADDAAVADARELLTHRGPDEAGAFAEGPVAFGFRRLSILDLENGQQPMRSEDGRFTLVFNGEIYNHPKIREELEAKGEHYRTRSDAESLLRLYEREGAGAFSHAEGMFAAAVYDAKKREVVLARDPLGVKPLYYSFDGTRLVFASELGAMRRLMGPLEVDANGVIDYLTYGFVHAPRTIFRSVLKLPPGHFLRVNAHGLKMETFWTLPARPPWSGARKPPTLREAVDEIERLLIASVRGQLLSDVPVGSFLSGGLDSSLITALMTRATGKPVPTFSIGFSGARGGLDESAHARAVARYLGTDHHELVLDAGVLSRIEDLTEGLDEPIADSAILPTYLLSKFARKSVKVVLTGEGADELFGGYGRYKAALLSEAVGRMPSWSRGMGAAVARRLGKGRLFQMLPHKDLGGWARATAHTAPEQFGALLSKHLREDAAHMDPLEWLKDPEEPHSLNGTLAFDLRTVLCDCLLMKVDKTTMRAGLEARVPYLDRKLVEYALHLPASTKIRRLKGKYALRRLARKYLPRPIVWRRKHGFIVPWEEWTRSADNSLLDDLMSGGRWHRWDLFDKEHLRWLLQGARDVHPEVDVGLVFRIAVLGLWIENWEKKSAKTL